jgi:hypothetical protein
MHFPLRLDHGECVKSARRRVLLRALCMLAMRTHALFQQLSWVDLSLCWLDRTVCASSKCQPNLIPKPTYIHLAMSHNTRCIQSSATSKYASSIVVQACMQQWRNVYLKTDRTSEHALKYLTFLESIAQSKKRLRPLEQFISKLRGNT